MKTLRGIDPTKVKRILIIKLRGIGDVVLSTIVLEPLKKTFPNASIDFLTENPGKKYLEFIDEIDEIIIFNRKSTSARFIQLFEVRKKRYDVVIDLFSNPATALITFFSAANFRIGFPYRGRKYAYNVFGPEERSSYHAADLHLELLRNAGLEINTKKLQFNLSAEDLAFAEQFIKANDLADSNIVCLLPSGGWQSKRIPPGKFIEIADTLKSKYKCKILIAWGPGDKEDALEISRNVVESIIAPNTTISQLSAIISKSKIVIANDSGPMHIAVAAGVPTLSIHGPTNPILQGAYGSNNETINYEELHCINCNLLECPYNQECFRDLPVERIMNKIENLIVNNNLKVDHA